MANETETKAKAGAIIIPVTLFEQNCTLIWCEATRKAVVIDPGGVLRCSYEAQSPGDLPGVELLRDGLGAAFADA